MEFHVEASAVNSTHQANADGRPNWDHRCAANNPRSVKVKAIRKKTAANQLRV